MLFAFYVAIVICAIHLNVVKKKKQDTKQYNTKLKWANIDSIEWNTYIPYQLHTHAITYIHDRRLEYLFTYIYT